MSHSKNKTVQDRTVQVGNFSALGEEREMLLMRYADSECGAWDRMRARSLLRRSSEATLFLKSMRRAEQIEREVLNQPITQRKTTGDQVWQRVKARIEQELHTELLLGRRAAFSGSGALSDSGNGGLLGRLFGRAGWSFAGAAVTAAVAVVWLQVERPTVENQVASNDVVQSPERSGEMHLASTSTQSPKASSTTKRFGRPHILEPDLPNTVEVDWMRGGGRVRMIPNEEQSPTFWINRSNRRAAEGRKANRDALPRIVESFAQAELFDIERSTLEEPVGGYFSGR